MIIDLIRLKNGIDDKIIIDENVTVSKEYLDKAGIIDLKNAKVEGEITRNSNYDYYVSLDIYGTMILPCSLSLKPTNYEFNIKIDDNLLTLLEEIDENVKKVENTIDIFPIIWENILMEIPMRVVNSDISSIPKEGKGWKLIDEDEEEENINPEFAKLKDLFK